MEKRFFVDGIQVHDAWVKIGEVFLHFPNYEVKDKFSEFNPGDHLDFKSKGIKTLGVILQNTAEFSKFLELAANAQRLIKEEVATLNFIDRETLLDVDYFLKDDKISFELKEEFYIDEDVIEEARKIFEKKKPEIEKVIELIK